MVSQFILLSFVLMELVLTSQGILPIFTINIQWTYSSCWKVRKWGLGLCLGETSEQGRQWKGKLGVALSSLSCWSDPVMWRLQEFTAFAFQVNDSGVKSSTSALWLSISFSVSSLALNFSVGVRWWHPWPLLESPFSLNYFQFPERPLDDQGRRLASSFPDFGLQWSHLLKQNSV